MSIDGLFTASIACEISKRITGGRIDKVSMPDRHRVAISIRHPRIAHVLVASVHPEWPRLSLTHQDFDDPEPPPAFCSVLRRHLLGGRIRGIRQPGLERLLVVQVERRDERGTCRSRICDRADGQTQQHAPAGLDSSTIIDCARHITSRVNRYRELLPGRPYVLPITGKGRPGSHRRSRLRGRHECAQRSRDRPPCPEPSR